MTRGVDAPEVEGYQWVGWKLIMIAKLNTDGTFHSRKWSCVWRPDVGSSLYARSDWMRAGGVGGVAWLQTGAVQSYSFGTGGAEVHVPLADHMGNVRHYYQFKSTKGNVTGQLVASYEYDAFGREVRAWGLNTPTENQPPGLPASRPWADLLPFHYSSKLRDVDSGFNYYGYRFYDPSAGRWLNRDPIGENGGMNLYGMVGNDPVNVVDYLGLKKAYVRSNFDEFNEVSYDSVFYAISKVESKKRSGSDKSCFEVKIWNRVYDPKIGRAEAASMADFDAATKECAVVILVGHGKNNKGKGTSHHMSDGYLDTSSAYQLAASRMSGFFPIGCHIFPYNDATDPDQSKDKGKFPIDRPERVRSFDPISCKVSAVEALVTRLEKYAEWDCCVKTFKICLLFGVADERYEKSR